MGLEKLLTGLNTERKKYSEYKVLAKYIKAVTKKYSLLNTSNKFGKVLFIKDGILIVVRGLNNIKIGEKVEFVGKNLFGRVVDVLGQPIDGLGEASEYSVERKVANITKRNGK
jgi:F0F1-type ATP synthase alpha subunit